MPKHFSGADFDGMQDLKTYRDPYEWKGKRVTFHADYVFTNRSESQAALMVAADTVAYKTGLPRLDVDASGCLRSTDRADCNQSVPFQCFIMENGLPEISHDSGRGEWYSQIVYQYCRATSFEASPAKVADLPIVVTDDYINETVARMLAGGAA